MASEGQASAEKKARRLAALSRRSWVAAGAAASIALVGVAWLLSPASAEETDDAYVAADATTVAPRVRATIVEILVSDNQQVRRGQPLMRLDPEEYDARVASAHAALADARAGVAEARAAIVDLDAAERLARAEMRAARTAIASARAQADRSDADRRRFTALAVSGAVSQSAADTHVADAVTARQEAARAQAAFVVSRENVAVTRARRGGLAARVQTAEANVQKAQAALDLALQDQRHTIIRAPIDGTIGNRKAHIGDYVEAGSQLLSIVPLHSLYVTANFKETQTERMRAGQPVGIKVDAFPGRTFNGVVESFAPGSGSTFALLPFEPGTGNFTKIVQRVPVRIRFEDDAAEKAGLRPGLSVTAEVHLKP